MSPRGLKLQTPVEGAAKRLSKFLGLKPLHPDRTPPTGPSLLAATLPVGIIEEVLLYLPGRDIVRMKQVRWDGLYLSI